MDINFNLDDFKKTTDKDYKSDRTLSFTLEDILSDFNKSSDTSLNEIELEKPIEQSVDDVLPTFEIDNTEIKKPEGISITGAFEAIRTEKRENSSEVNFGLDDDLGFKADMSKQIPDSCVATSKEITDEIDKKRFFDTDTFNSIKQNKKSSGPFASLTKSEDEEDDGEEQYIKPVEPTEEIDDYFESEDREDVLVDLKKINATATFKTLVTFVLLVVSGVLFSMAYVNIDLFNLGILSNNKIYLAIVFFVSIVASLVNINSLIEGVRSLVGLKCIHESLLCFIFFFNAAIDVNYLLSDVPPEGPYVVFDFLYMLLLFFNIFSKQIISKNILKNFLIVSSDGLKTVVNKPVNEEIANDIILETGNGGDIAYASKSNFILEFIHKSFGDYSIGRKYVVFDLVFLIIILCLTAVNYYINRSFVLSFTYAASCLCTFVPMFYILSCALPLFNNSRKARRHGGAIIGANASNVLNDVQTLIVDDSDVFNVTLNGIRLYGDAMIDNAIIYLNSLYRVVGGPLKPLFSDMLSENITSLPRIDDIYYHENLGYSATIHSKEFIVGNKDLMGHFGIEIDDSEYELIYQQKGKHVLFVAYDGKLMGVFLLSYSLSFGIDKAFKTFERDGICVAIAERDANVNEATLFGSYKAKDKSIFKIMNFRIARGCFDKFIEQSKTASLLVSNAGLKGIAFAFHGCRNIHFADKANSVVKIMASVIGFILMTFLLFFSSPTSVLPLHILLYQLLWALPLLFVSLFSK